MAKPKPIPPPSPSPFWSASDRTPDAFPITQRTTSTIVTRPPMPTDPSRYDAQGYYQPKANVITLASGFRPESQVGMHETGHAIWYNDLTPEQRDQWVKQHAAEVLRQGIPLSSVHAYSRDPAHSFAETYGLYASDPLRLQKESPGAYNLIRSMSGFEYRRK